MCNLARKPAAVRPNLKHLEMHARAEEDVRVGGRAFENCQYRIGRVRYTGASLYAQPSIPVHMATCLNSLAAGGVFYPMRVPYVHTYVFLFFPIISYYFLLLPVNTY